MRASIADKRRERDVNFHFRHVELSVNPYRSGARGRRNRRASRMPSSVEIAVVLLAVSIHLITLSIIMLLVLAVARRLSLAILQVKIRFG
jgi:hypothetical protein